MMTRNGFAWGISLATALCVGVANAEQSFHIDDVNVELIESVDVCATKTGLISSLTTKEGDSVTLGQSLGGVDDREARIAQQLAEAQLSIAQTKATDDMAKQVAQKKLDHQIQLTKQKAIALEIAKKKAKNEVRVEAAKLAEGVAENELERANESRRAFEQSVSGSEVDGLRLAYERAQAETKQARFDLEVDILDAKAEQEAMAANELSIEQHRIELAQAIADQKILELQAQIQKHQTALASLTVDQHRIIAPFDGVVVDRIRNVGDWVETGDPIVRVIRLNRLRVEGFALADVANALRKVDSVQLFASTSDGVEVVRTGEVVFVSPEMDAVTKDSRFLIEFDNPKLDILPGSSVDITVTIP